LTYTSRQGIVGVVEFAFDLEVHGLRDDAFDADALARDVALLIFDVGDRRLRVPRVVTCNPRLRARCPRGPRWNVGLSL
jgi:hypothetical protein